MKPLATKARKHNVKWGVMFDAFDTNRDHKLSAEELQHAMAKNKIAISSDDVMVLKEYFRN